jgi:small neutral amino acid transporter SnatA (MarC family)
MSMAIYPLAIPLLLNPVGIVSLTVFSAEAQGLLQFGVLVILVLVVAAIDLGVFLVSHRLDKYLTNERVLVLEKLLGIFFCGVSCSVDCQRPRRLAYYYCKRTLAPRKDLIT